MAGADGRKRFKNRSIKLAFHRLYIWQKRMPLAPGDQRASDSTGRDEQEHPNLV
jgi:hypothetical protein